jgi:hypothetical protein
MFISVPGTGTYGVFVSLKMRIFGFFWRNLVRIQNEMIARCGHRSMRTSLVDQNEYEIVNVLGEGEPSTNKKPRIHE